MGQLHTIQVMPGPWVNNTPYRLCQDLGLVTHYTSDAKTMGQ